MTNGLPEFGCLAFATAAWTWPLVVVFWSAVVLVGYTYAVFPLVVYVRGRWFPRPVHAAEITPRVSMLVACHNEATQIEDKLQNTFELDYPRDLLQIIVASDGSTDATEAIVARHADRVLLLSCPRQGKARALNAAAAQATGEVLVFSDANSMFEPQALRQLMRPLADDTVGGVAGNQRYLKSVQSAGLQAGERSYWSFDRWLKRQQSRGGSVTSATGAIYAVRRTLFAPIPDGMTDDFIVSTRVVAAGHRLVFAEDAVAFEPVAESGGAEFQRKVRLMTRGLRGVLEMRQLLNPLRYGFYALQLCSHKVLRRLVVFPLLALLLVSPLLWHEGWIYRAAAVLQFAFLGLALVGRLLPPGRFPGRRWFSLPAFFVLANSAALLAAINIVRGRRFVVWSPQRSRGVPCGP